MTAAMRNPRNDEQNQGGEKWKTVRHRIAKTKVESKVLRGNRQILCK